MLDDASRPRRADGAGHGGPASSAKARPHRAADALSGRPAAPGEAARLQDAFGFVNATRSALMVSDASGTITLANPACEHLLGYDPGTLVGLNVRAIVPARFHVQHTAGMAALVAGGAPRLAGKPVEITAVRRDGSEIPIELSLSTWHRGGALGIGASIRDLSEQRQRDARLLRLAHHDPRSGLPNGNRLVAELTDILGRGGTAVLLALGVEGLRSANETFGHTVGDALLEALAVRLTARLEAGAMLARIRGDELAVLVPGQGDPIAARARAHAMQSAFAEPVQVGDHLLPIGATIGAALAPNDGADAEEIMASADLALHEARRDGIRCFRLFESPMRGAAASRRGLIDRLRLALERREFELHYQPQVELETGRICGAEALIRWRHPERGLRPPGEFLPAIESSVLALPIGWWTIEEACRQAAAWRAAGLPPLRVAVNLFAAQLRAGTLDTVLGDILERHGLPSDAIEIELTETIALRRDEAMIEPLRKLHARGTGIAFDDFGTGFASLATLRHFPLTKLKIDRSFVQDVPSDPHDAAIVEGIVAIGRGLGLSVIAEGIETPEQGSALIAMGCRLGQGFLYGKPLDPRAFARRLAEGDQDAGLAESASVRRRAS